MVRSLLELEGTSEVGHIPCIFEGQEDSVFSMLSAFSGCDDVSIVEVCTILCLILMSPLRISWFGFLPQI